jgi:transcription elongation factor GreA
MVVRVPMSKTGRQRLREELIRLERTDRMEIVKSIEVALGHGDLKENAEYHAAKERQALCEGRILELKDKLGRAEVIDCTQVPTETVVFGTVVDILDLDSDEEITYQLLGSDEADVKTGSISVMSPWGKAMIGKEVGDEIEVKTPKGLRQLEIVKISPGKTP